MTVSGKSPIGLSSRAKQSDVSRNAKSRDLQFRSVPQYCVCVCLTLLLSADAFAQELSRGWRRPSPTETSDKWRQKNRTRFLTIKADFDGDGKPDMAELFVNSSTNQFGVFVRLADSGVWLELVKGDLRSLPDVGIAAAKRGRYKTACGKGYGDYACAMANPIR